VDFVLVNRILFLSLLLVWGSALAVGPAPAVPSGPVNDFSPALRGYAAYLDNDIGLIPVLGTSMAPAFRTGDNLLWVRAAVEDLEVGDIVLWETRAGGRYYAHRLIRIVDNILVTKGDNNPAPDEPVLATQLLGRVIGVIFTSSGGWHG
jgi:signal peptidase I